MLNLILRGKEREIEEVVQRKKHCEGLRYVQKREAEKENEREREEGTQFNER